MDIVEANEILGRYEARSINILFGIYKDPNIDNSWWSHVLWDVCIAVETKIAFQNK